jgi:hypothetical protein
LDVNERIPAAENLSEKTFQRGVQVVAVVIIGP